MNDKMFGIIQDCGVKAGKVSAGSTAPNSKHPSLK